MDPDWSRLPNNVLDTILERLDLLSDYFSFSVVCTSWYYVAKDCKKQQRAKMMSSGYPPMLLIHTNEDNWILYNAMKNKVLDLQLGVPQNYKHFCGSAKGWLIAMDENLAVILINPFLRVKGRRQKENSIIRLPSLTPPLTVRQRNFWCKNYERFVYKATITADPISNADDCIVVVMYEDLCRLAFIRINKDTTWTYIGEEEHTTFEEVSNVDGEFFAVNNLSELLYFEITSQLNSDVEMYAYGVERSNKWFTKTYLVHSDDKELLLVHRYIHYPDDRRKTKKFRVFQFDLYTFEWTEKNTLGDGALFLGDNSSVYVSASKFPRCKPNHIYFNHDGDRCQEHPEPHDFGVYNLKNGKFSVPYNRRAMNLLKKTSNYPIWIMPTFQ